jgi:hypothetical protein
MQMSKRAGSTAVEVPGSHAIYVSNPRAVAVLIEQAADAYCCVFSVGERAFPKR